MIDRLSAQMQAMQMLSRAQDATADNLANINTPGFKGSKLFYRLLKQEVNGKEVTETVPMQKIDMKQGVLEPTGNPFDFGLQGQGFFQVQDAGGNELLSRDGRFHIDADGYLVNGQADKVMGKAGPVHIPEYFQATNQDKGGAKLEVADDGTIRLNNEVYDKIRIVKVDDTANLERRGNNYFAAKGDDHLVEDPSTTVMQGFYEKGNVNPLGEMVDMMRTMKMFESQQRALRSSDEMLAQVAGRLGKF